MKQKTKFKQTEIGMIPEDKKDIYVRDKPTLLFTILLSLVILVVLFSVLAKSPQKKDLMSFIMNASLIILGIGVLAYQLEVKTMIQKKIHDEFRIISIFSLVSFIFSLLFIFSKELLAYFIISVGFFVASITTLFAVFVFYKKRIQEKNETKIKIQKN